MNSKVIPYSVSKDITYNADKQYLTATWIISLDSLKDLLFNEVIREGKNTINGFLTKNSSYLNAKSNNSLQDFYESCLQESYQLDGLGSFTLSIICDREDSNTLYGKLELESVICFEFEFFKDTCLMKFSINDDANKYFQSGDLFLDRENSAYALALSEIWDSDKCEGLSYIITVTEDGYVVPLMESENMNVYPNLYNLKTIPMSELKDFTSRYTYHSRELDLNTPDRVIDGTLLSAIKLEN